MPNVAIMDSQRPCETKYLPSLMRVRRLVKAVISNFTYKKFFSQKLAGGKRSYSVCLALNTSASMNGHLGNCAQETLICLIAALNQCGINFSIITFGQRVRIIKTDEQEWGPMVLWTLMNYRTSNDTMTMDADGIEVALQLVQQRVVADRKIFLLTDGYGTCGLRLPLVLDKVQKQGINLVAISVGVDRTSVKNTYSRFVIAMMPALVPQALRALYLEEACPPSDDDCASMLHYSGEATVTEVLENTGDVLEMLQSGMAKEREANLVQGDKPSMITVDIAFCLDCTGSMSAWIAAAKGQILTIVEEIETAMKKAYIGLEMEINFCLVGFRDVGELEPFIVFPRAGFTKDKAVFRRVVQSLVAHGGDDGPEDLLGALDIAGTQLQWESKIKFLIVITDAPAHGQECNDDPNDRFRYGLPNLHTMASVMQPISKKKIDLIFCQIKKSYTSKTLDAMRRYYDKEVDNEKRKVTVVRLFDADKEETRRFHFVFCLDESGSMSERENGESKWDSLLKAYTNFINKRRNDQGFSDVVSTITFYSSSACHGTCLPIQNVRTELKMRGGGTNFDAALSGAASAFHSTPVGAIPMLIFMSDGNGRGTPVPTIEGFKRQYPNFVCHTVGLGLGSGDSDNRAKTTLTEMATAGGGKVHLASIETIADKFGEIAAGCAAMDGLVKEFSERIAETVATRICMDHM
jgi:Mg-chelatase subunit ChlD/uncharacterized protein YegL